MALTGCTADEPETSDAVLLETVPSPPASPIENVVEIEQAEQDDYEPTTPPDEPIPNIDTVQEEDFYENQATVEDDETSTIKITEVTIPGSMSSIATLTARPMRTHIEPTTFTIEFSIELLAPELGTTSIAFPNPLGTAHITTIGEIDIADHWWGGMLLSWYTDTLSELRWHPIYDRTEVPIVYEDWFATAVGVSLNNDLLGLLPIPQDQLVLMMGPGSAVFCVDSINSSLEYFDFQSESSFEADIISAFDHSTMPPLTPTLLEFLSKPVGITLTAVNHALTRDIMPARLNTFLGSTTEAGPSGFNELVLDIVFFE
jgi:hypothetical protein